MCAPTASMNPAGSPGWNQSEPNKQGYSGYLDADE